MMGSTLSTAAPDLGTVLQAAVTALTKVIESKPGSDKLLTEMVRLSGEALKAGGAGVWVTETADRAVLVVENNLQQLRLMTDTGPIQGVLVAVRRCAREGKPLIVPAFYMDQEAHDAPMNPSPFELFYVPMKLQGRVALVMAMAVPPPPASPTPGGDSNLHRTYLNFLARMVAGIEQTLAEHHVTLMEKDRGASGKLVKFTDQVHKHLFLEPVAIDIANLTRDVLEADRVIVELYPTAGRRRKIMAVSNVDEPNKRAALFQVQRLIFDYVRDRHVPVVLTREAIKQLVSDTHLQDAAAAYFAATTFNAFLATPIKSDDPTATVLGVVLAEFQNSTHAQSHASLAHELARLSVNPVANALEVESVPLMRMIHGARSLWRSPGNSKRSAILATLGLAIAAIVALAIVPFDFSIKADCIIRPSAQIAVVAPMEGRIIEIPVGEGEHVYTKAQQKRVGDKAKPLAIFDSTELIAQRADQVGKLGELQISYKDFEQRGEMTKMGGAQQQIDQVKSQIALLDHEIDQCTVWSPIEGTNLTENVEQKRWSTPKKSEPLMEVASFSDWELVVDVPESDVEPVREALADATRKAAAENRPDPGIEVDYSLYAWAEQRYVVQAKGMATLLPASHQNKTANVFRLQIKLDGSSLPPGIKMSGLTGRAKIHLGSKPLLAQWTRPALRMLRMTLFF